MGAELEQLRKDTKILAKKFKDAGQDDLAALLDVDAQGFSAKAKIAFARGLKTFNPAVNTKTLPQPEVVVAEPLTFTDQERETLVNDGAVLYLPTGETIKGQREAGRPFWYVASGFKEEGRNRLTEFPSRRIEVAIYPDPEIFFVPGSFNKTTDQQDALSAEDSENLRKRLGLAEIGIIRPEASEATEIMFKHFDATEVRLLGKDYMVEAGQYYPYIRTNTPTVLGGSRLACVGGFGADDGPSVFDWDRAGRHVGLGAARWVVPQRSR